MNIKPLNNKQEHLDDPFLFLGYGLNAYFNILKDLSTMCLMIALFISPVVFYYAGNDIKGLKYHLDAKNYGINQFTLGNLGGSSVYCGQRRIGEGNLNITCPYGNITVNDET